LSAVEAETLGAHLLGGFGVQLVPSSIPPLRSDLKQLYADVSIMTDSDRLLVIGLLASLSTSFKELFIRARNQYENFRNLAIAARERMNRPDEAALVEALESSDRRQIRSALA
jgi:hypothetical protein